MSREFPNLPRAFQQVLRQGGGEFQSFYYPWQLDITTQSEVNHFLKYFNEGQQLQQSMCHRANLDMDHTKFGDKLTEIPARMRTPRWRGERQLAFPSCERIAPWVINAWLQHRSITSAVDNLAARAGSLEKDSAGGYLAREIKTVGLILADLLSEFHPVLIIFSSAVERLVSRLVVLEETLSKDPKDRYAHLESKLSFMGVGGNRQPSRKQFK